MDQYNKKTNTGDPVIVRVNESESSAPTTLLFGWFGAEHRHLAKYAALYEGMGYSTVAVIAPTSVVFSFAQTGIPPFLVSILHILHSDPRLLRGGLVVHAFSNGGACFLVTLSDMFSGGLRNYLGADDEAALKAVRKSLAAVVFDSAPAYLHADVGASALVEGLRLKQGMPLAWIIRLLFHIATVLQNLFYGDVALRFWNGFRTAKYGTPELYVYSKADHLTDPVHLEALVRERASGTDGTLDVHEWKVDDARHVQILRRYPEEYKQKIRGVNEWGINRYRKIHGLDEWKSKREQDEIVKS